MAIEENKHKSKEIERYERLVQFQADLMEHLYDEFPVLFQLICTYMECSNIAFLLCDSSGTVRCLWYDADENILGEETQPLDVSLGKLFRREKVKYHLQGKIPGGVLEYAERQGIGKPPAISFFNGVLNTYLYTGILFHRKEEEPDIVHGRENFLLNNIQVCLENRIYHELIIYESQHDLLTKLFNRRSYFTRIQEEYPFLDSIGVLYFDVNNLKKINDCYGHDAGDAFIQKAAESIRCLTGENVHGYRMGGDEFILVAKNCTRGELDLIRARWERELKKVNEKYGGEPCIIAVGSAYAEGSFEIEEVCQLADKRMYRDKLLKKKAVG